MLVSILRSHSSKHYLQTCKKSMTTQLLHIHAERSFCLVSVLKREGSPLEDLVSSSHCRSAPKALFIFVLFSTSLFYRIGLQIICGDFYF